MSNRRLTQRQRARIQRQQDHRRERAAGPPPPADEIGLGPERTGLVIANFGAALIVEDDEGDLYRCAVRQNLGRLACGDRVVWQPSGAEEGVGVVVALIERRSLLTRPDYRGQPRPVAANLDEVAVVLAPEPEPSEYLLDRYLVAIAAIGVQGLLVLNKVDLLDAAARAVLLERLEPYRRIGYPLLLASNRAARGLDELRAWLGGRVSLLVGQSGSGKSSLVQAGVVAQLGTTDGWVVATFRPRGTTTTSTLYHLPGGGWLIDTPGVRSFELGEIIPDALDRGFPELTPHLGRCRFSDCRHQGEPGCALAAALAGQ